MTGDELRNLQPGDLIRVRGIGWPIKVGRIAIGLTRGDDEVEMVEGYDHRGGCRTFLPERVVKVVRRAP